MPRAIATSSGASQRPAAISGLDCNGYSLVQTPIKLGLPCTDIASNDDEGFLDNGHYVGHDEADGGFFSRTPGSGGNMRCRTVLPIDPHTTPQPSFNRPTWDSRKVGSRDRCVGATLRRRSQAQLLDVRRGGRAWRVW
jgi:hypothetical protein